jgi:aminopeptidase-like protein
MNIIKIEEIFDKLFPISRSITGPGFKKSINIIKKYMDLKVIKVPSGKKVFDWVVPHEWELHDGYIKFNNKKILDAKINNLSVVNFSESISQNIDLESLKKKIHTHPKLKNAIPYVTSYYSRDWGFCMQKKDKEKLKKGKYEILIKTSKKKGNLEYSETNLKGKSKKIFLLSTFLCHPSMANNELSGPLTMLGLYENIKSWKNKNLSYKFLINPETIGSICFLHKNKNRIKGIIHSGTVLTCLGGKYNHLTYYKSRFSLSPLDRLMMHFEKSKKYKIYNFDPSQGGDERQFCSSDFNLPIGRFERNGKGHFREYHTHLDTKKVMGIKKIEQSIDKLTNLLRFNDYMFPIKRYEKYCELFLSKRQLYPKSNNFVSTLTKDRNQNHKIIMSILSYADGNYDFLHIAELFKFPIENVLECLQLLIKKKLVYLKL